MRFLDFTSWQSVMLTLIGVALLTLISMGIRLVMMFTIQQRRERTNRQINERLKTLIAAYKTLGGSFTGNLSVDPSHLRDMRHARTDAEPAEDAGTEGSERARRIRDAVEAALSDIILLGTEEQVKLAAEASRQMVAGNRVQTDRLVISLRNFIREALDLAPVPAGIAIPSQGPVRPAASGSRERSAASGSGGRSGGGGAGGMGMGDGTGGGMGIGMGGGTAPDADDGSGHSQP